MAELAIVCPPTGTGGGGGGGKVDVLQRTLLRTGGQVPANTAIDVNSPGAGWQSFGNTLTWSGTAEFPSTTQIYRNGTLQLAGDGPSADFDVYLVSSGSSLAFECGLEKHDVISIWKFNPTSG